MALVKEVSGLAPGTALDLGCGQGGDAIWLAEQGWQVTAVDISAVALERGAGQASALGISERITWEAHDLGQSFPSGSFDLVSSHYLHSPFGLPRAEILRAGAMAVNPGGTLLIVGHAGPAPWQTLPPEIHLPSPEELLESLRLPAAEWEVLAMYTFDREHTAPNGEPSTRPDNVLKMRRVATPGVS